MLGLWHRWTFCVIYYGLITNHDCTMPCLAYFSLGIEWFHEYSGISLVPATFLVNIRWMSKQAQSMNLQLTSGQLGIVVRLINKGQSDICNTHIVPKKLCFIPHNLCQDTDRQGVEYHMVLNSVNWAQCYTPHLVAIHFSPGCQPLSAPTEHSAGFVSPTRFPTPAFISTHQTKHQESGDATSNLSHELTINSVMFWLKSWSMWLLSFLTLVSTCVYHYWYGEHFIYVVIDNCYW